MSTSKKQSSKLLTWHISLTAVFNSNLLSIWLITQWHTQILTHTHIDSLLGPRTHSHTRAEGQQLAHHLSGSVGKCSDFQSQCDILIISMLACVQAGEKMMMASSWIRSSNSSSNSKRKPRMRWLTRTHTGELPSAGSHTHTCSKCQDSNRRTFAAPEAPLVQDGNYFMLHTMSSMPHKQTAAAAADSGVVIRGNGMGECINTVNLTNTYILLLL